MDNFLDFDKVYNDYFLEVNPGCKKGACYVRVSTDVQVEYSPTSQLKIILNYAKNNDIFIEKENIFHDDGISGTGTEKREQFKSMIAKAKSKPKPFDVILVYDFSRFARNKEESVMYKSLLRKKQKIDVVSVTQPLTEGKERVILESMYEAMDEYYSLNLSENVKRGKLEKAQRGEHNGNAPYGYVYSKETKKITIDEETSKVVKFIFSDFIENQNLKQLCFKLNNSNMKPLRGGTWGRKTLKLILTNRSYIGEVKHRDTYFKGTHEPIIDNETFEKVQKIYEYRDKHFAKCKEQIKHNHWLRGILKCGDCGKGMCLFIRKTGKKDRTFQCAGYNHGLCTSHYIAADDVEEAIIEQLKKDFTEKININIDDSKKINNPEKELLINSQKKLEIKLQRIKDSYINGIDTLEEYKANKEKILKEKETIESKLKEYEDTSLNEEVKENVYKVCKQAYEILSDKNASDEVKSKISHELFNRIDYDKSDNTLIITYNYLYNTRS